MTKLSEIEQPKNILVMGSSGTGKTRFCGTLAQLVPTVIVTGDVAGLTTLRQLDILPETEIVPIEDWKKCWSYFLNDIKPRANDYAALAIDDLGGLEVKIRQKINLEAKGYREEQMSPTEREVKIREQLMLGERKFSQPDWGESWVALSNFLSECLKLPFRVKLVTVLEGTARNPRTGDDHIYPALQKASRQEILARFSLVGELFIAYDKEDKPRYCLHSRPHPKIETKDRFLEGGRTWVNPTMPKVLAHINYKGEPETDTEKKIGTGL